jgi:selenide,water dikinase
MFALFRCNRVPFNKKHRREGNVERVEEAPKIKLTSLSSKGGCGCKIGPADLMQVIRSLPAATPDPNLLVGLDTSDDAGVYKLTDDLAMVQTVDFFTPIVDDPYSFGQIAAANAISDIYAMGGKPLTVLNIVAFPITTLDKRILADILRGASDKVREAGATLVGGHSIDDQEPKFGLAVTGIVHPDKVRTNAGAKAGDRLILTKPIGVGILTTSIKKDQLSEEEVQRVTQVMSTLNKQAAETMEPFEVHACTDVTGFGLIGHALEMAKGSGAGIRLQSSKVPVLPRVRELAEQGFVPGGTKNNFNHVKDDVTFPHSMDQTDRWILCDAVTSGGLLISVEPGQADRLLQDLINAGVDAHLIGEVTSENAGHIVVEA